MSSKDIIDNDDEPLFGHQQRTRLNSSEIPRTYSGLYGAGAPPMPSTDDDDDDDDDVGAAHSLVNNKDEDGSSILSPPRVKKSSNFPNPPSTSTHHGTPKPNRSHHNHHRHHHSSESNLLPFELSRNRNTDWIAAGGPALLVTYISVILIFLLTFLAFVTEPKVAWTMANVAHGVVSLIYLHWIKGNPADYMDGTQGEMNAMTCWEQIVSKPAIHLHCTPSTTMQSTSKMMDSSSPTRRSGFRESLTSAIKTLRSRDVLCVVPTLLAHASCHIANYEFQYVVVNVGVWSVVMLPKMPFMNGVRILGINRTAGIDDGDYLEEDDDEDECYDSEDESSKVADVRLLNCKSEDSLLSAVETKKVR